MAQWIILRDARCSSWTLDETSGVQAELSASLARDIEGEHPACLGSFCRPSLPLQCHTQDIL